MNESMYGFVWDASVLYVCVCVRSCVNGWCDRDIDRMHIVFFFLSVYLCAVACICVGVCVSVGLLNACTDSNRN